MQDNGIHRRATGHAFRIRRRQGYQWYVKYRFPSGRQVQKLLGPAWTDKGRPADGFFTKKTAEQRLRAILADADRGLIADPKRTGRIMFSDAAAEFLRYIETVREAQRSTVKDYRGVIDGYLDPEFGDEPLDAITADQIDAYKERLMAEGKLSNRTIVRHLTVLHGIFKRAKRKWGLTENPAAADLVERPTVVYTGEFDTFQADEIERLANAADSQQDAAIYKTAAFTGLRQGELLALRWKDVDLVDALVHVRRNYTDRQLKIPKGKRIRSVPMMPVLIDVLARLKERPQFTGDDDLVFASPVGEFLDAWALRRRYYRALSAAGLRRIRFHDLRHAFGSAAITQLDGYAVQSYMGHQHYSTTQRYLHHQPRPEDAAKLARAFGGGEDPVSPTVSRSEEFSPQQGATERNEVGTNAADSG